MLPETDKAQLRPKPPLDGISAKPQPEFSLWRLFNQTLVRAGTS